MLGAASGFWKLCAAWNHLKQNLSERRLIRQPTRELRSIPHASREHYLPPCQEIRNKMSSTFSRFSRWFHMVPAISPEQSSRAGHWSIFYFLTSSSGDSWWLVTSSRSDFPKCLFAKCFNQKQKKKYIKHVKHIQTKSANGYKWAHWGAYTCQIIAKWVGHKLLAFSLLFT